MKVLSPSMQDGEEAGFDAQSLGVGGKGEEGFADDTEERIVDDLLVIEGNGGKRVGKREDHVEIGRGQQFGSALL